MSIRPIYQHKNESLGISKHDFELSHLKLKSK